MNFKRQPVFSVLTLIMFGAVSTAAPSSWAKEERKETTPGPAAKIQWFGTWKEAAAEAKRTGRPILLTSAAPQCKGTPGIW